MLFHAFLITAFVFFIQARFVQLLHETSSRSSLRISRTVAVVLFLVGATWLLMREGDNGVAERWALASVAIFNGLWLFYGFFTSLARWDSEDDAPGS